MFEFTLFFRQKSQNSEHLLETMAYCQQVLQYLSMEMIVSCLE